MSKYYVYSVKSDGPQDRLHMFVVDPLEFARESFDPEIMEFTGVSVEAESYQEAADAYAKPTSTNLIFSCEEPMVTKIAREFHIKDLAIIKQKHNMLEQELVKASISLLIEKLQLDLLSINHKISALARCLYGLNDGQSIEYYYEQLKRNYTEELSRSEYRSYGGPDEGKAHR